MELPDTCPCGHVNMIDWENLEIRPVSKLMNVSGYECSACRKWKPCSYSNRQLDDSIKRICSMKPTHPSFAYYLAKAMKRSEEIQKRGMDANGSLRHTNMVAP